MVINKELTVVGLFEQVSEDIRKIIDSGSVTPADYYIYTVTDIPPELYEQEFGLEYPYCAGISSVELGVDIKSYGVIREVSFRNVPTAATISEAISRFKFTYLSDCKHEQEFPLFLSTIKFPGASRSKEWSFLAAGTLILPHIIAGNYKGKNFLRVIIPADELEDFAIIPQMVIGSGAPGIDNSVTALTYDNYQQWETQVNYGLDAISSGKLDKVVLSRQEKFKLGSVPRPDDIYNRLLGNNNRAHRYYLKLDRYIFFGATPEILISKEGNSVYTEALAGTLKLTSEKPDPEVEDFPEKDIKEHLFVRDFVCEVMEGFGAHIPKNELLQIKKAKTAAHLWSPVSAALPVPVPVYTIAIELFPTPAVAGYPKKESIELINSIEQFDRGLFTGIVGIITGDLSGFYLVAIRCGLLENTELTLYAGCGIVSDSQPMQEFAETKIKLATLLSLFSDADKS